MIVVSFSIGRRHWINNTDDVGPFHERWVLTPSKGLGKIRPHRARQSCVVL